MLSGLLAGCALYSSGKQACHSSADCLNGYTCNTTRGMCEPVAPDGHMPDAGPPDAVTGVDPVPAPDAAPAWVLASGQGGPIAIAVDDTSIYWVNNHGGQVMKMDKAGGTPVTLASGQTGAYAIAVDGQYVYWTTQDSVMKLPLGGGTPVTVATGQTNPIALAVDATNIYWTAFGTDAGMFDGKVLKAPIAGGPPVVLASNQGGPFGIAVDATYVYWCHDDLDSSVMRVPIAGGSPSEVSFPGPYPTRIALNGSDIYWTDSPYRMNGKVLEQSAAGGAATTLASGFPTPWAIVTDGKAVYWTNRGTMTSTGGLVPDTGSVMGVFTSGGQPFTLAATQNGPGGIAVDENNVYWVNELDGTVLEAPKP